MKLKYGILIINLLAILSISALSCTKLGKNVTIEGRVMNPITGEGIEGIELELLRTTAGLPGGYKSVKSTRSNTDGSYEISKGGLAGYWLACRVPAEYYQIGWVQNGSNVTASTGNLNVKKGKTMHADFYAVPYGEYQIKIKNINCTGSNDSIILKRTNEVGSFIAADWVFTGCADYTTSTSKVPMGKIFTKYTVIRSGISTDFETDFMVVPNQMNYQEILY